VADRTWTTFLLRYGEIGIKSRGVRRHFEDKLEANLERSFAARGVTAIIDRTWGRFFLESPDPEVARDVISRTFGLVHGSPVEVVDAELDAIAAKARQRAPEHVHAGETFAIRARRTGDHPFGSPDVARRAGDVVLDEVPEAEVDLDDPDREIHIEVRHDEAFVFTEFIEAPGGLPVGSQGKIVVPLEGPRGPAAAWLSMRRGAEVHLIVPVEARALAEVLAPWGPGMRSTLLEGDWSREGLLAAAQRLAKDEQANAIALGEHESKAEESQGIDHPVLRPLAGLPGRRWPEGAYQVSKDAAEAHPGTCLDADGQGAEQAAQRLAEAETRELSV
jgi:adenylyl- and sulfurtransferase ThiI